MKSLSTFKFLALGLLAVALLASIGSAPAGLRLGASTHLAPAGYTTQLGSTGGQQISNMVSMEQAGLSDDPSDYVSFTTPGTVYRGYRSYFLPANILWGNVTSLQVKVNYKGLAAASQTWAWDLYDWSAKKWVNIGDNSLTVANRWKLLAFNTTWPRRFINSTTREIRLLLRSNNASGNAKLDYESILLGYNPPATATPTRTPTRTPTSSASPTITPTPSTTPSSVHFAVIGDYGINNANEADVAALVKSWDPNFVITTGDNNYLAGENTTIDQNIGQYYHEYIDPYMGSYGAGSSNGNRFFPSLGNHDWDSTTGANPYLAYFTLPGNERYYEFGRGPVHFFVIDSDPREPDGTSDTSIQAVWLQNQLAAATEPWKIVYFHHPAYSSSNHGSTVSMQWNFQGWGASAVLNGHDHTYERISIGGFPYFVDGLGGQAVYSFGTPVAGSQVRYNAQYGAMLVDATATQITFQFIGVDGTVADTFTLP
jgi:hypothetical protein